MNKANYLPDYFKRPVFGVWKFFCFIFLIILSSCQEKKTGNFGYSEAFKPIFKKATLLFGTDRVEQGMHYIDSASSTITLNADDSFRILGFHYVYWKKAKNDNQHALMIGDTMLMLARKSEGKSNYVANYVEANMAIGDAYFDMQRYNDAYQHYFIGYTIGKNNLNNRALSDYAYRMGMITYKTGSYQLAAKYFKDSFRLSESTDDEFADFYRDQEVLDNIALSYKHNNQPDSAIVYFDKALVYINKYGPRFNVRKNMIESANGVVYGNKAEVLIAQLKYSEAAELLKQSIEINLRKGNDNTDAALAEIKLAQIYFDTNQNDALFALLSNIRPQLDKIKNADAEANWNRLMSAYYERNRNFEFSLNYLKVYNVIKDSINQRLNRLKESNINEQLENYEKQYKIDSLLNNNRLQQIYLYILIASGIAGTTIIALVFRNWKRSKRDIATVNKLNEQVGDQKIDLEKTLEELKSSSFEKDRILRTVAHDLRNPIGGISSLTKVMLAEDDLKSGQMEMINLIKETSDNSLELINEILEVTDNGKSGLKKALIDINSLLSRSVELLRFKAAEKHQNINLSVLNSPCEIWINREKIWRVIGNLISNSIKFSPVGASIEVGIIENENDIEITVSDKGIGIPQELQSKVFNMFSEAKRIGTAGEKSFGLGLSISKQIMESHDGQIWFDSLTGIGSTFHLKFPKPVGKKEIISENLHTTSQNF